MKNTDDQRAKVAGDLGISVKKAKRGFNAVMFGVAVSKWMRKEGVRGGRTSATMDGFERDVRHARTLLAELEVAARPEMRASKATTILSRVIEREEEKAMRSVRTAVEMEGWRVGTLIHDALVVHKRGDDDVAQEQRDLERVVSSTLASWNEDNGWSRSPESAQLRAAVEAL